MPQHRTSLFENVAASVSTYVRDFLEPRGHVLRYPGLAFDAGTLAAWFELDVSPGPSRFHRQAAEGLLGATDAAIVRLDAKARRDANEETYRRWRMADDAFHAFPVGKDVDLRDYLAGGPPYALLGRMRVRSAQRSNPGERDGLLVARVEARLQYSRYFAP